MDTVAATVVGQAKASEQVNEEAKAQVNEGAKAQDAIFDRVLEDTREKAVLITSTTARAVIMPLLTEPQENK